MFLKNAFSQPLDASICSTNLVMVQECKFVVKPNFLNKEANFTINNTNIWVNLGCFSGISCCERRNNPCSCPLLIVSQLADASVKEFQNYSPES